MWFANFFRRFFFEEKGQGITEYGAMLAFVAVLVGFVMIQCVLPPNYAPSLATSIETSILVLVTALQNLLMANH